jgi:hypothetical protein
LFDALHPVEIDEQTETDILDDLSHFSFENYDYDSNNSSSSSSSHDHQNVVTQSHATHSITGDYTSAP